MKVPSVPAAKAAVVKATAMKPIVFKAPKMVFGAKPVLSTPKVKSVSIKMPAMRSASASLKGAGSISMPSGVKAP